ncbi:MAG: hypothetical protein K940chlam3_00821 [Chlamydiae bacterium]|nr:hypothetical protein [Chlamydiota bacterium]
MNELESKFAKLNALKSGIESNELKCICKYFEKNRKQIEKTTQPFLHLPSKEIGTRHPIRYNSQSKEIDIFLDIEEPFARGRLRITLRSLQYHREEIVVIKVVETTLEETKTKFIRDYHNLLQFQDIPGIVPVYDFTKTEIDQHDHLEMVQKYYNQGNLIQYLEKQTPKPKQCESIILQLLTTVAALHAKKILIQDLSPLNILINITRNSVIEVGLGDLETLTRWEEIDTKTFDYTTNLKYAPPEFWKIAVEQMSMENIPREHIHKIDIWCLGECLWMLLSDTPLPWAEKAEEPKIPNLFSTADQFEMLELTTMHIPEPKDLMSIEHLTWEMLQEDPTQRIEAQEALEKFKKIIK